jgi:hypothetical protein
MVAEKKTISKDDQKKRDQEEADRLNISYKDVRKQRRKREVDHLAKTPEQELETKRMRAYSQDGDADQNPVKKRRTRSMDLKEVEANNNIVKDKQTPLEWRKEHNITVQGHGSNRHVETIVDPYFTFEEAPFNASIQQSLLRAGFTAPTSIQSQAWPIALQRHDMICVAKTGSGTLRSKGSGSA